MGYYTNRRYNPPADVYAASTIIGPFTGGGAAEPTPAHGGHAISTRTGGALANRIQRTLAQLELVPLAAREELWAAAWGGATHAQILLAEGRRAKAGVVHACARRIIDQPV